MRKILLVFVIIAFPLFLPNSALARRGCCSWHGGVAYCDTSVGRLVCNDGTYSPSCGCYYAPVAPTPTPIIIPTSISGTINYQYNDSTKSYDVTADWDDWNQSSGWSIGISQYAGADPGQIMDTTASIWQFRGISPGRKYINLKALVNGNWSRVAYWTVDIPPYPTLTPTPTITPTSTITPTPSPTITKLLQSSKQEKNHVADSYLFKIWNWLKKIVRL